MLFLLIVYHFLDVVFYRFWEGFRQYMSMFGKLENVIMVMKVMLTIHVYDFVYYSDVGHNLLFNYCNLLFLVFLCKNCYFRFR